jgi:hypothetical protein
MEQPQETLPELSARYEEPAANAPAPAPAAGNTDLLALFQAYKPGAQVYGEELRVARERADREQQAFDQLIKSAAERKSEGPSKAEMYFRLASAFGAPTRTGHFTENLSQASGVMAEHQKGVREADSAQRNRATELSITAAKMKADAAKGDLNNLRSLAAEEMRDQRAVAVKALEQYIASGRPQSDAGKLALDAGLKPGTPEYQAFVNKYVQTKIESGDYFKMLGLQIQQQNLELAKDRERRAQESSAKLTPAEMKLKTETEDILAQTEGGLKTLAEAFKLNENSFSGSLADRAQYKVLSESGSKDPKVVNTGRLYNLLGEAALDKLKSTFGAAPTEGERQILLDLQGIGAKSIDERKQILARAYKIMRDVTIPRHRERLDKINRGLYRTTQDLPEELK